MPSLQVAIDARGAKIGAIQFINSTDKMKRGAKEASVSISGLDKRTKGLGGTLRSVAGPLTAFFGGISSALVFRKAATTIRDFEQSLATLGAVAGATGQELEALEITARRQGATTRFSASEAADGLLFLARAGFDVRESIEALPSTLNLATAGVLGLGEAADIASNILRQFNLGTEETERVVDALVNTANNANTDVRQLAEAMKFAGPIANKLGQDVETTAAQIGVLGDAGIQASMAGTNLRGVMLALASPTTGAEKAFASLGLSIEDVSLESNTVQDILKKLADANISAGQAAEIFGRRNAAAAIIIGESTKRVEELTKMMDDNTGAAEAQARAMDDTLAGAVRNLNSSFEEALLAIGDQGFGGVLRKVVQTITDTIRVLIGMESSVEGNIERATALAAAFKLVLGVLTAIVAIKAAIFFGGLAKSLTLAATASLKLSAGLSPVLVTLAAISAAVAGIEIGRFLVSEFKIVRVAAKNTSIFLLESFEDFKLGFEAISLVVSEIWRKTMNFIRDVSASAVDSIAAGFQSIEDTLPRDLVTKLGLGGTGQGLREFATDIRSGIDETPIDIAGELSKKVDETNRNIAAIKEADRKLTEEIEKEFGGRATKGQSFLEFVKRDAQEVIEKLKELNEGFTLTSKATADVSLELGNSEDRLKNLLTELDKWEEQQKLINAEIMKTDYGNTASDIENTNEKLKGLKDTQKEVINDANILAGTFDQVGNAFSSSLESAIFEANSLKDVVNELGREISKIAIRSLVTQPAGSGLSGLLQNFFTGGGAGAGPVPGDANFVGPVQSALGNVFNQGRVVAFQSGGVIDGPNLFPLSGGRTGLAGESGPEAILPLARDGRGRLGVRSDEKSPTVVNNNITMNVSTPDASSFRQSKSQILSDLRSGVAGRV